MYKEKIINFSTGEETWRDYTEKEIAEVEKAKLEAEKQIANKKAQEEVRKSALSKLINLGLTEEEIAAL